MKMTPGLLVVGSLMVFWSSVFVIIMLPAAVMHEKPSAAWRQWTPLEQEGHDLYVDNGCSYCHSQFVRTIDWGAGAERIAQAGDYVGQRPAILGTERTGPDLSQEGGEHPDDWHIAHFTDPRFTRPLSLMPNWEFLGPQKVRALTAYVQALGGRDADGRVQRQEDWNAKAVAAHDAGTDANVAWLHDNVPQVWRDMPNPYPATDAALARGQEIFQQFCVGCHGLVGDGQGPAAEYPEPAALQLHLPARPPAAGQVPRRHPLLPDNERHHGHRHALLQARAGIGEDMGRLQLRRRLVRRLHGRRHRAARHRRGLRAALAEHL